MASLSSLVEVESSIRPFYAGTLAEWNPETKKFTHIFTLDSRKAVYLGRDASCDYVLKNPFISRRHLCIYTITIDQENPEELAPLVYARNLSGNDTLWNKYHMSRGNGSFLLSHGDFLHLRPNTFLCYLRHDYRNNISHLDTLQSVESRAFQNKFAITQRILGSGAYGKVLMAYRKDTGQQLACKIVDLRAFKEKFFCQVEGEKHSRYFNQLNSAQSRVVAVSRLKTLEKKLAIYDREAQILEQLSHPNIIGIEKVIKSSNTIFLFQDLITAGDLFSYIQYKGGKLPDIEAAVIVRQVLMALDYLHDQNIVHRDLKPDNILMTSLADGCRVVLTDFGCARLVGPKLERMSSVVGTLDYSAPEVLQDLRKGYTKAVDLWSLGCVAFVLLTGDVPFQGVLTGASIPSVARATGLEQVEADFRRDHTGERAVDFVRRLLVFDEAERMDVKQALEHDWFTNRAHKDEFDALYMRSIKSWKPRERNEPLTVQLRDLLVDSGSSSESNDFEPQSSDMARRTFLQQSHTMGSSTLSDPELPPLRRMNSLQSRQSFGSKEMSRQSQRSSVIAQDQVSRKSDSSREDTQSVHVEGFDDHQDDQRLKRLAALSDWYDDIAKSTPSENHAWKEQLDSNLELHDDDEVYEEIDNPMTGEIHRRAYGNEYREDM